MDITIFVQEPNCEKTPLQVPIDMGMSLMEVLKSYEYPIEAICGGMALCATCHIEILEGELGERTDPEMDMLDTLFNVKDNSRLACQIRMNEHLDGMLIQLLGENS